MDRRAFVVRYGFVAGILKSHHRCRERAVPRDREDSPKLDRRRLLQGGALFAGAAGVAAVAGTPAADAATGDPVTLGQGNTETKTTTITVSAGSAPALSLVNTDGPQLRLNTVPDSWDGAVAVGDIVNTTEGPVVGIDYGMDKGAQATPLLTPRDIFNVVPFIDPLFPQRVLDTRTSKGRVPIVRKSSPDALTSAGKLKAGHWIDLGIDPSGKGYYVSGWFFNVTVVEPEHNGYMSVYAISTEPPTTSTSNRASTSPTAVSLPPATTTATSMPASTPRRPRTCCGTPPRSS